MCGIARLGSTTWTSITVPEPIRFNFRVVSESKAPVSSLPWGRELAISTPATGLHMRVASRVAYAEERFIPAARVLKLPDNVTSEVAAGLTFKALTVEYLIRRCFTVKGGDTVLFHAAAGGVGSIACQWLSELGATVIGTVSGEAKAAFARANGCDGRSLATNKMQGAALRCVLPVLSVSLSQQAGTGMGYSDLGHTKATHALSSWLGRPVPTARRDGRGSPKVYYSGAVVTRCWLSQA
jgi:hypothetical protein